MNAPGAAKHIQTIPSAPHTSDGTARPKIMRRPPQFSMPSPVLLVQAPSLNAPHAHEAAPLPTTTPWQDDERFAIALVILVVGINLLLSAWLSPAPPRPEAVASPKTAPAVAILNELNPPESNQ